jgi:bifunctional ADP-heptose synthase (sugar kinase/adenylyltransferase)
MSFFRNARARKAGFWPAFRGGGGNGFNETAKLHMKRLKIGVSGADEAAKKIRENLAQALPNRCK